MNLKYALIFPIMPLLAGCRGVKDKVVPTGLEPVEVSLPADVQGMKQIPKARIYRTNGDYNEYVPVTLNAARSAIVSYPAPSDITAMSAPVALAGGWLLDRRGISGNSAFTRITYSEYMELTQAPSPQELLEAVIPDARVTEIVELPMTLSQAVESIGDVNSLIVGGLKECKLIYHIPSLKQE